jgi:hypothetical protein
MHAHMNRYYATRSTAPKISFATKMLLLQIKGDRKRRRKRRRRRRSENE